MKQCEDCGQQDDERMYPCGTHPGVYVCRGCKCPKCEDDWWDEITRGRTGRSNDSD